MNKVKEVGLGFILETLFDCFVPTWVFRFCSLTVYQLDVDKLAAGSFSSAVCKICDRDEELEQLIKLTNDTSKQVETVGAIAKVDGEIAGGLWTAIGNYRDYDLGLQFLLGDDGAWIYSARVEAQYRRCGIYSQLLAVSAEERNRQGRTPMLIGVSKLNSGSVKRWSDLALRLAMFLCSELVRSFGPIQPAR